MVLVRRLCRDALRHGQAFAQNENTLLGESPPHIEVLLSHPVTLALRGLHKPLGLSSVTTGALVRATPLCQQCGSNDKATILDAV